jgi:hypothetical protein
MIISSGWFTTLVAFYGAVLLALGRTVYKHGSEKCDRKELEVFKKDFIDSIKEFRTDIKQISKDTEANKVALEFIVHKLKC